MTDAAVRGVDIMRETVKQYFVRSDAGRADVLDLFTDDVQLYFPEIWRHERQSWLRQS